MSHSRRKVTFSSSNITRQRLEIGLAQLKKSVTCNEVLFWGKIIGEKSDYFLAVCIHYEGKYEFPDKTFFWASSADYTFAALPDVLDQHREFVNVVGDFSGDHSKVLK